MAKSLIFTLAMVLFSAHRSRAQTYHPIPSNGVWVYQMLSDFYEPLQIYPTFTLQGDTTIAGRSYRKLFLDTQYQGGLRDSAKRIHFYPSGDSLEHVLYDFNLSLGDTVVAPYPMQTQGTQCDTVVVAVEDSFETAIGYRRALTLQGCGGEQWVEGIGSTEYLPSPTYMALVSGWFRLTCVFDSTSLIYSLFSTSCFSAVENPSNDRELLIYPSPMRDVIHVSALSPIRRISFSDVCGKCWISIENPTNTIDVAQLPSGLYIASVKLNDGYVRKLVVKQ